MCEYKESRTSSGKSTLSDVMSINENEDSLINAELGLSEDHFAVPEGHFRLTTQEELEMAIENCKEMVLAAEEHSEKRRNLCKKLVQLRLKMQELKEGELSGGKSGPGDQSESAAVRSVLGHTFIRRRSKSSKHYCERCCSIIWGLLQAWYRCKACGFCCHAKCVNLITRMCASVKVSENPAYILSICPEIGLSRQNYRCADCRARLSYRSSSAEPRQCDYSGLMYCNMCHWNDVMIIPGRVCHNWDFTPHRVCRASKQFLKLLLGRPVLDVWQINPMLFTFIQELNQVNRLREDILVIKQYFLTCASAREARLLVMLEAHQHFVENSTVYSLQELIDVNAGVLLPQIQHIHSVYSQHIRDMCKVCYAKGFLCELCDRKDVLFCFDEFTTSCSNCGAVYHRECWMRQFGTSSGTSGGSRAAEPAVASSSVGPQWPRCARCNRRHDGGGGGGGSTSTNTNNTAS